MRKFAWILVALSVWPGTVAAQSVLLPSQLKVEAGGWVHVKPIKIDGGAPKWRLDPELEEIPPETFLPPDIAKAFIGKLVKGPPGKYKVEAWNAKGDAASDIATCWVVIGKPGPQPPPDPPVPTIKIKSLTFVVIGPTPKTAAITEDEGLRVWLKARGIGIYGITTKAQQDANPKFAEVVSPAVALQDENNKLIAWTSMNSMTVESAKAFVISVGR